MTDDPLDNPNWGGFANPSEFEKGKEKAESTRQALWQDIADQMYQEWRQHPGNKIRAAKTSYDEVVQALRRLKGKAVGNLGTPEGRAALYDAVNAELPDFMSEERRQSQMTGILGDIDRFQKEDLERKREAWERQRQRQEDE